LRSIDVINAQAKAQLFGDLLGGHQVQRGPPVVGVAFRQVVPKPVGYSGPSVMVKMMEVLSLGVKVMRPKKSKAPLASLMDWFSRA